MDLVDSFVKSILHSNESSERKYFARSYRIEEFSLKKPLRKLLFSATQTKSVTKLANLSLVNPTLFTYNDNRVTGLVESGKSSNSKSGKHNYWLPFELEEFVLVCKSPIEKLLSLIWYLEHYCSPLSETGIFQRE